MSAQLISLYSHPEWLKCVVTVENVYIQYTTLYCFLVNPPPPILNTLFLSL